MYKTSFYLILLGFGIFLASPLLGLFSNLKFEYSYYFDFFNNNYNIKIILISFYQAFLSSFISCIIAIFFSISLFRQKKLFFIKFLISLSGFNFVLPSILIVYAYLGLYGKNGYFNTHLNIHNIFNWDSIFGLKAIIICHVLLNAPFATRLFFQNLNTIPSEYIDTSKSLRFTFLQNFVTIEWPFIKQSFASIFSIIFILCFLSFAIVMSLGGSPRNSTIEVAIYHSLFFELNFNKAVLLSFIQIFICTIFILIGTKYLKGKSFFLISLNKYEYFYVKNKFIILFDYFIIFIFSCFFFSPLIYILYSTFYYFDKTSILFEYIFLKCLFNSILISFFTGLLVTFLSLIMGLNAIQLNKESFKQKIIFLLTSLGLLISPVILSLGFFLILGEFRYNIFIAFILIILINTFFLLPFGFFTLFIRIKNVYLNYIELKKTYRIKDKEFILIIYPLLKNSIFFVFAFSLALSFGDLTIISFFKTENFKTLPVLLYDLIFSYRFADASLVSGIILLVSITLYLLFDKLIYKESPVNNI